MPARPAARSRCRRRCRRCSPPASTSSSGRAEGARARRGRGRGLPPRRRAGARTGGAAGDAAAGRARAASELIRPDRPQLAGEDGFRFRHLLIRDAAYDALPKATRAELHERFADWLEEHGAEPGRAGRDPRLPPRAGRALPGRARSARGRCSPGRLLGRLAAAGERARWRGDLEAAHSLLGVPMKLVEEARCPSGGRVRDELISPRVTQSRFSKRLRDGPTANADAAGAALARALVAHMRLWTGEASADRCGGARPRGVATARGETTITPVSLSVWYSLANGAYNFRCRAATRSCMRPKWHECYENARRPHPHDRSDGLYA